MYTDVSNIAARLGIELTNDQANYFSNVLDGSIDAYIERQTDTFFGGTEPSEIFVDGEDSRMLIIPTMHTISAVHLANDDGTFTLIPSDAYRTYPQGEDNVYAIRNLNGEWEQGYENYRITGVRGFMNVPGDIREVATELAANAFNSNQKNYKSEKVGDWAVTYADNDVTLSAESMSTIANYRRLSRSI